MVADSAIAEQLARLEKLGGPAFVRKMIGLFLDDVAPKRLAAIEQALAAGDLPALEQAAHGLKSSAGNLGVVAAQDLCERIEQLAGAGSAEGLPGLVDELKQTLATAIARLQSIKDAKP